MSADPNAVEAFLAEARNAIVIGRRRDGRPHATPNWFVWDGTRFSVSTTKGRVKYRIFRNDPRVQLIIDDSVGFRYVSVDGAVSIEEDVEVNLPVFTAIRAKHGRGGQSQDELRAELIRDQRVLLVITPDQPAAQWASIGL